VNAENAALGLRTKPPKVNKAQADEKSKGKSRSLLTLRYQNISKAM